MGIYLNELHASFLSSYGKLSLEMLQTKNLMQNICKLLVNQTHNKLISLFYLLGQRKKLPYRFYHILSIAIPSCLQIWVLSSPELWKVHPAWRKTSACANKILYWDGKVQTIKSPMCYHWIKEAPKQLVLRLNSSNCAIHARKQYSHRKSPDHALSVA